MANKGGGTHLKNRLKGNRLWCSFHKEYHTKQSFHRAKNGRWQGWCKDAMRESVKKWKAKFKEQHGESYG